jgi:hypothetical protein
VRGWNNGAGNDPDVASRVASGSGGATGDAIGSLQSFATALPRNTAFSTSVAGGHSHSYSAFVDDGTVVNGHVQGGSATGFTIWGYTESTAEAGDHTHTIGGGDGESRPVNVGLGYIIKL